MLIKTHQAINVKNTIQNVISDLVAPNYCCSCGNVGSSLCVSCIYDITSEPYESCICCHRLAKLSENICFECKPSFSHAWVASCRQDGVKRLLNQYKFDCKKSCGVVIAELLDACLPCLPDDIIVTTIPTINKHIRERGFDHIDRVANYFAESRNLRYENILQRNNQLVQHNANRTTRIHQAENAFRSRKSLQGGRYLLIDDICTTGSTLEYGARQLLLAGADEVWVAVVASQPLEKDK